MASNIVKYWKEAATVILVAKSSKPSVNSLSALDIKTKQNTVKFRNFDYKVLMLERSSKSKFMPRAYVFPGGKVSKVDFANKWNDVFKIAGFAGDTYSKSINHGIPTRETTNLKTELQSPMFGPHNDWGLSSRAAFRINAIRETFEETGILVYQPWKNCTKKLDKSSLSEWRSTVYNNNIKFLDMCIELNIVPDIWSLYEWSNWLTPVNMEKLHQGRRYDTAFFICMLPKSVDVVHDEQEIVSSEWCDPEELLNHYANEKLWLAPPQIYELYRLYNFSQFDHLHQFAKDRSDKGCERWLPVRMVCDDITIATLPGDDLYPSEPDIEGHQSAPHLQYSSADARLATKNHHRFEFHSQYDCELLCNVDPTCNMPMPMLVEPS